MSGVTPQLPLAFAWSGQPGLAECGSGLDHAAVDAVAALTQSRSGCVVLWGATAVGKTWLLRAAGQVVAEQGDHARYFSARDAQALTELPGAGSAAAGLFAIDELELLAGDAEVEEALFRLCHRAFEGELALLIASARHPGASGIVLPDLRSRLLAAECYRLNEPDDRGKREIVLRHAASRGIPLAAEIADLMLTRLPRDLHTLCAFIDQLDRVSLARRCGPSTRLARELIETLPDTGA
jgi:DnaA-homolog protein